VPRAPTRCRHGDAQDVYDSLLPNAAQQFPGMQLGCSAQRHHRARKVAQHSTTLPRVCSSGAQHIGAIKTAALRNLAQPCATSKCCSSDSARRHRGSNVAQHSAKLPRVTARPFSTTPPSWQQRCATLRNTAQHFPGQLRPSTQRRNQGSNVAQRATLPKAA
jgi:hypothetical protein